MEEIGSALLQYDSQPLHLLVSTAVHQDLRHPVLVANDNLRCISKRVLEFWLTLGRNWKGWVWPIFRLAPPAQEDPLSMVFS